MTTRIQVKQTTLDLVQGDITQQETEAIVNAANSGLAGGAGVDGAIHRAAGWEQLQAACRAIGTCDTGDAVLTPGFNLKAKYIIHAVGPVYAPHNDEAPRLLASAYQRSLEVAAQHGIKTIAFPAISTGVYGYPMPQAATIALQTAATFAQEDTRLSLIRFVLFDSAALASFKSALLRVNEKDAS